MTPSAARRKTRVQNQRFNVSSFRLTILLPLTFLAMSIESIVFTLLLCLHHPASACNSARKPTVDAAGGTSNIDESVKNTNDYEYDYDASETAGGDIQSGGFNIVDLHLHSKVLGLLITILIFIAVAGCFLYICRSYCCRLKCCQPCCATVDSPSDNLHQDRLDPPVRFSDVARLQEDLQFRQPMLRQRPNFLSDRFILPQQPSYNLPLQHFSPSAASEEPIYVQLAASQPPQPFALPAPEPVYASVVRQPASLPPPTATGAIRKARAPSAPPPKPVATVPPPSSASLAAPSTAKQPVPTDTYTPALSKLFAKEKESSL